MHAHQHDPGAAASPLTRLNRRRMLGGAAASLALPAALTLGSPPAHAQESCATPEYAPVPETAHGPAIPAEGYLVEEIGGGLYWLTEGIYQAMFLVTGEGVVVVDAPPTIGNNLLRGIAAVTDEPITHVIYSHSHADHIGAAVLYPVTAERIAHAETARLLEVVNDPNRPLPTRTFEESYDLRVGDQTLHLEFKGNNHSPDNIFVWAPRQETLLLIDIVFPGWVPFKELAQSQDIPGWFAAHDQALSYPFQTLVSGHLGRLGTREDVETQQEYLTDLRAASEEALLSVDFGAVYAKFGPDNAWAIFEGYLDAVATQAAEATLATWRDRLGGADVFTYSNAFKMAESLRIDNGILGPFGIRP